MPTDARTYYTYPTKFGPITVATDGSAITNVILGEAPLQGRRQPAAITTDAANQIMEYLAGRRTAFAVPLNPEGSSFQRAVWKAVTNVPYGHTTTARAIAETLGTPESFRSVGAAVRRCPTPLLVPTHRVVAANGKPAGDSRTQDISRALLALEQRPAR